MGPGHPPRWSLAQLAAAFRGGGGNLSSGICEWGPCVTVAGPPWMGRAASLLERETEDSAGKEEGTQQPEFSLDLHRTQTFREANDLDARITTPDSKASSRSLPVQPGQSGVFPVFGYFWGFERERGGVEGQRENL